MLLGQEHPLTMTGMAPLLLVESRPPLATPNLRTTHEARSFGLGWEAS